MTEEQKKLFVKKVTGWIYIAFGLGGMVGYTLGKLL